jgi:hypothetical protein
VVRLDFEVVLVDAGQFCHDRNATLASIDVHGRENTCSRQLARPRQGTHDAIHFALEPAQLTKRVGASKETESGHRSLLP